MPNKPNVKKAKQAKKTAKSRPVLWLLVAVLVVAAIALTIVLGVSSAQRVLSFRGIRVDRDLYAYWQARYRYEYLQVNAPAGAYDTEGFWNSVMDETTGMTYGEDCEAQTQTRVLRIVTAAYLFDTSGLTLTDPQRQTIADGLNDLLTYRFDGDEKKFDEAAKPYGFSFSDVKKAYLYEYKAVNLPGHITLSDEQISSYYTTHYTRVQWLYLPASTPAETITHLRGQLASAAGANDRLTLFSSLLTDPEYNQNPAYSAYSDGYYFSTDSIYLDSFRDAFTETYPSTDGKKIYEAAFSLENPGDYTEVSTDDGLWVVMRYPLNYASIANDTYLESMFADLNELALADYLVSWLDSFAPEAKWKTGHAKTWVPHGQNSDLYLFF